jgi:hypothetical protein
LMFLNFFRAHGAGARRECGCHCRRHCALRCQEERAQN